MTRPKAIFRKRPNTWRAGEYTKPSDKGLDERLRELIVFYRAKLYRLDDEPSRSEVRETLRKLSIMSRPGAAEYWRMLHASVLVEIKRAARHASMTDGLDFHRSGPDDLPSVAAQALAMMPAYAAGRRTIRPLRVMFATALAGYWFDRYGILPRVRPIYQVETDFQKLGREMYRRIGFSAGDIQKELQEGVRAAKKSGRLDK